MDGTVLRHSQKSGWHEPKTRSIETQASPSFNRFKEAKLPVPHGPLPRSHHPSPSPPPGPLIPLPRPLPHQAAPRGVVARLYRPKHHRQHRVRRRLARAAAVVGARRRRRRGCEQLLHPGDVVAGGGLKRRAFQLQAALRGLGLEPGHLGLAVGEKVGARKVRESENGHLVGCDVAACDDQGPERCRPR